MREILSRIPQYVTTDNAFHKTIPFRASRYVLPEKIIDRFGFRKYGFHGLSFHYVAKAVPKIAGVPAENLKMVVCHLGTGGSEVAAIEKGRSVDASMGYTGLPGIVMSTRCGDIDSSIPLYLMAAYGYSVDDVQDILNNKSGLLGLCGETSDIRDILERVKKPGEEAARVALKAYVHSVKRYIGAFTAALRGIDYLVFTDDVGIQCPEIRGLACADMGWCGDRARRREKHEGPAGRGLPDRNGSLPGENTRASDGRGNRHRPGRGGPLCGKDVTRCAFYSSSRRTGSDCPRWKTPKR
jgi:acetate kinase